MAEELLDDTQISSIAEEMGSEGMPQEMGINVSRESAQLSDFFHYLPKPLRGQPAPMPRQENFAAGALAD
jgi:hypothetical protein